MPICYHFLRGVCTNLECPYLHVNLGPNAKVCPDFNIKGYCPLGSKCSMKHVYTKKRKRTDDDKDETNLGKEVDNLDGKIQRPPAKRIKPGFLPCFDNDEE
mmetsp:Transcript_30350/g.33904  ORF Transcript_30350/g.33904 Transcript_30350/m.33904 type:complete len:101 (+) Transcript_30350:929-1231(+)